MIGEACHFGTTAQRRYWVAYFVGGLTLLGILALGGCGGSGGQRETAGQSDRPPADYGASSTFPVPREIEPNVDFWRHVFGIWSRDQVAFHDDEHMDVIYEVVRLPGSGDGYSNSDKSFIASRARYHQDRLEGLQQRVTTNQPLSTEDKALLAKFDHAGGTRALYGAADRVRSQRGMREKFRRGMEISGRYEKSFREVMRAKGLPEDLVYIPHVESSYQTNARSPVGAAGVWQFMPATGKSFMMVNGVVDDRYDPILAADGAARYLDQAHKRLGSWPLAVTSYNHGQGGMANAKAQYGHDFGRIVKNYQGKAFKFASRNYYAEFIAAREVAGHPNRYFPEGVNYESPWPHDRLVLRDSMPADHVARHYGVSPSSLADLNLHWREPAKSGRALLPTGSTVWLPAGSTRRVASQPPPYTGTSPTLIARTEPRALGQPITAAATALAYQATRAEPVSVSLNRPTPKAAAQTERPEPRIAKAEARPIPVEERSLRPEPRTAKSEPKDAKPQPKTAKADAKPTKPETKTAKADAKATKPDAKTAKADAKSKKPETKTAAADAKAAKSGAKTAKADTKGTKPEAKTAKAEKSQGKSANDKFHIVKPQETLFRVASNNGISVAELRKLNKLGPNDNSVRPGQKLKVGS